MIFRFPALRSMFSLRVISWVGLVILVSPTFTAPCSMRRLASALEVVRPDSKMSWSSFMGSLVLILISEIMSGSSFF